MQICVYVLGIITVEDRSSDRAMAVPIKVPLICSLGKNEGVSLKTIVIDD